MCVVVPHPLGKGARCAPPLHPPGSGQVRALSPNLASKTYRRFITRRAWRLPSPPAPNHGPAIRRWTGSRAIAPPEPHSQGDFGSPCTHRLGRRSSPHPPPDHFMETNPARFGCAPCHGDDFIETMEGCFRATLPTHQPLAGWMGAGLPMQDDKRVVLPTLGHVDNFRPTLPRRVSIGYTHANEGRWPPYPYRSRPARAVCQGLPGHRQTRFASDPRIHA